MVTKDMMGFTTDIYSKVYRSYICRCIVVERIRLDAECMVWYVVVEGSIIVVVLETMYIYR